MMMEMDIQTDKILIVEEEVNAQQVIAAMLQQVHSGQLLITPEEHVKNAPVLQQLQ